MLISKRETVELYLNVSNNSKLSRFFFRRFLSRLPDKGEKIRSFHDKISKELEHRNKVEEAANMLSWLNIASKGKEAMSKLEWTGKCDDKDDTAKIVELDSDDEEDPLKILAQVDRSQTLVITFDVNRCNKHAYYVLTARWNWSSQEEDYSRGT